MYKAHSVDIQEDSFTHRKIYPVHLRIYHNGIISKFLEWLKITFILDLIFKVYENINDLNGNGRFIRGSKGSGTSGRQSSKSRQRANNRNPVGFSK